MKDTFLYQRVYDALHERISSGLYSVNTKLPTEHLLSKEFNVSIITVKKALNMLTEQGLITRISGKGTFVTVPAEARNQTSDKLIGVIFEHIASPYGLSMMYHMDEAAERMGYKLIVRFSYCRRKKETQEIIFLLRAGVQGLIIMPSHGQHYNPAILKLVLDNFPVVLIDKQLHGIKVPSVRTDNALAMQELVRYMKSQGCRNIGLITNGESDATSIVERREGFYQGIQAEKLPVSPECSLFSQYIPETTESDEQTVSQIYQYLQNHQKHLDGVICSEYSFLPRLIQAARELHIQPGKDLQICCIDEDDLASCGYTYPHMKQDEIQIAKKAMSVLLERLEDGVIDEQEYVIPALFREGRKETE